MKTLLTAGLFCITSGVVAAQSTEEIAIAKATLSALQGPSFDQNREFCGYFAYDEEYELVATPATTGERDACAYDGPEEGYVMVISYHTHGRFNTNYAAEVPSVSDIEADEDEGIDGFVATPGGRLWYVDTTDMVVRQICGLGCLPQDPRFIEGDAGPVDVFYTYDDLLEYEGRCRAQACAPSQDGRWAVGGGVSACGAEGAVSLAIRFELCLNGLVNRSQQSANRLGRAGRAFLGCKGRRGEGGASW